MKIATSEGLNDRIEKNHRSKLVGKIDQTESRQVFNLFLHSIKPSFQSNSQINAVIKLEKQKKIEIQKKTKKEQCQNK